MPKKKEKNKAVGYIALTGLLYLLLKPKKAKAKYSNLNRYLALSHVTNSAYATKNHISEQFNPPERVFYNADYLAQKVLNPIIRKFGLDNLEFDSWYRAKRTNTGVGGVSDSFHLDGGAVDMDLIINGEVRNDILLKFIVDKNLPFTELAVEYGSLSRPKTVHLALIKDRPEFEVIRITDVGTTNKSLSWLRETYS